MEITINTDKKYVIDNIDEAIKILKMEKENREIKKGDIVKVVNTGEVYSTPTFLTENEYYDEISKNYLVRIEFGHGLGYPAIKEIKNKKYKVLQIIQNKALITENEDSYYTGKISVIGLNGLEKLN